MQTVIIAMVQHLRKNGIVTDVLNLSEIKLLKNVSTLICEYTEKHPVVSYASDSITLQSVVR